MTKTGKGLFFEIMLEAYNIHNRYDSQTFDKPCDYTTAMHSLSLTYIVLKRRNRFMRTGITLKNLSHLYVYLSVTV